MFYSFIIPMHNCEQSITIAIRSIVNCCLNFDYEIICVDDGSTDNTNLIVKKLIEENKNIKYIYKKNEGVSSARNAGLFNAIGDYVFFVDSDDEVAPTLLNDIRDTLNNFYFPDMIIFGFSVFGDKHRPNDTGVLKKLNRTMSNLVILQKLLSVKDNLLGYVRRACFKKSFIKENKLLFLTNLKISEDYLFLANAIFFAKSVCILDKELYIYKINKNSVTTHYIPSLQRDMELVNQSIENIIKSVDKNEVISHNFLGCKINTYIRIIQNYCRGHNYKESVLFAKKTYVFYKESLEYGIKHRDILNNKLFLSSLIFKFKFTAFYIWLFMKKNNLLHK